MLQQTERKENGKTAQTLKVVFLRAQKQKSEKVRKISNYDQISLYINAEKNINVHFLNDFYMNRKMNNTPLHFFHLKKSLPR